MHMFVKQYMRLQFARDANENYKEKRTKLVCRKNYTLNHAFLEDYFNLVSIAGGSCAAQPGHREACQEGLCTAMFEQFAQMLYRGFVYRVEEIE
jgi:hypothetical protein